MATSYPGGLDNFTNPTANDTLDSATVPHAEQHANANDAIEAIETELGTNPSGTYTDVKARLDDIGTTVTSPITNAGSTVAPVIGINASSSDTANYVVQRDANQAFSIGAINFDTLSSQVAAAAKLYWDGNQTLNLGLGGGNVNIALGQEVITYVTNAEATTLNVGEVVYLYGAQGDRPTVKRASNTSDATSSKTFGIVAEAIAANGTGFVMNRGVVSKVNTAAFNPGDILWLSATPGQFTKTKPVAPNHLVFVGVCLRANAGNGLVFVSPQNGYELDEIHDVLITSPSNGEVLTYDSASGLWKNAAPAGDITAVNVSAPITGGGSSGNVTIGIDQTALAIAPSQVTGTAVITTDSRLSDARTPTAHAASHGAAGSDPVTIAASQISNGTTTFARLGASNAFTVGGHTITAQSVGVVPLTLTGASGQTANLLVASGAKITPTGKLDITPTSGDTVAFRNSAGNLTLWGGNSSYYTTTGIYMTGGSWAAGRLGVDTSGAANIGVVVRGVASQTADIFQIQDPSGNVYMNFSQYGGIATNISLTGGSYPGRLSVGTGSATTIGAVIRGAAAQTANLLQTQNSGGTVLTAIDAYGALGVIGTPFTSSAQLFVRTGASSYKGIGVRGEASQSGDLLQFQNSGTTVLGGRNAQAQIYSGSTAPLTSSAGGATTAASGDGTTATITTTSTHNLAVGDIVTVAGITPTGYNGTYALTAVTTNTLSYTNTTTGAQTVAGTVTVAAQASVLSRSNGTVGLIVQGQSTQTADLQRWTLGTGLLSGVDNGGRLYIRTIGNTYGAAVNVSTNNTMLVGQIIRGVVNQSADSFQYQTSAGTITGGRNVNAQIYSGITAPLYVSTGGATTAASGDGTTATITTTSAHGLGVGDVVTVSGITPTGYNGTFVLTAVTSTTISYANTTTGAQTVAGSVAAAPQSTLVARSAGTVGQVIRGAASQSSDLSQWRDSTNAILAQVLSTGRFQGTQFATTNGYFFAAEENAGAFARLTKQSTTAASPGANNAKLYFRDGTNAGTLKLVVRAGAAGAETTILDNIPQ